MTCKKERERVRKKSREGQICEVSRAHFVWRFVSEVEYKYCDRLTTSLRGQSSHYMYVHDPEKYVEASIIPHLLLAGVHRPDRPPDEAAVLLFDGVRQLVPLSLAHPS